MRIADLAPDDLAELSLEEFAVYVMAYKDAAKKSPRALSPKDCAILRSPPRMPAEWPDHWPPRSVLREEWPPVTLERIALAAQKETK